MGLDIGACDGYTSSVHPPEITIKAALSEPAGLTLVRQELSKEPMCTRTRLAQLVCAQFGFVDALGRHQTSSCLKALRDLESAGLIDLPAPRGRGSTSWQPRRASEQVEEPSGVPGDAGEFSDLRVVLVEARDDGAMRCWNELMIREHPRGLPRLAGAQLKYLVESECGTLGAVAFSACALRLESRDEWIGWNASQATQYRKHVVNLSRLLIRPSVRCKNLASRVLGKCVSSLPGDFEGRYGYRPWIIETFVDREQHIGTCFLAANWERIGETKGRGRNDMAHEADAGIKDVFVYPLLSDFRDKIGVPPSAGRYLHQRKIHDGLEEDQWAVQEFGEVELGDKRLRDRLIKIVDDRSRRPGTSYLDACGGDLAAIKGYYRLIDHADDIVDPDSILSTHKTRTIERCMSQRLVLAIQDTTDLNFSSRPKTSGLGFVGTNQTGAESSGLRVHSALACTVDGLPLGILNTNIMAQPRREKGTRVRSSTPIEEKKSFRWIEAHRDVIEIARKTPDTRFLTVADRESDFFELFQEAEAKRNRVGLLVRAKCDRIIGPGMKLEAMLTNESARAAIEVEIPRQRAKEPKRGKPGQDGSAERRARLTVCFGQFDLKSTGAKFKRADPIKVWGILAFEENPPKGAQAIHWRLITTERVESAEDAAMMIKYYSMRWRIEEWHRVLKSGVKVLEHQHGTAEALARIIAVDCVLAWRLQLITLLGREHPDLGAEVLFHEWEIRLLKSYNRKIKISPSKSDMSLRDANLIVAILGGYLNRPSDPPPGAKVMWRGLIRLFFEVIGYRQAYEEMGRRPP